MLNTIQRITQTTISTRTTKLQFYHFFKQRFGISNPTPKYAEYFATDFSSGTYSSNGLSFGKYQYGDIIAAISDVLFHTYSITVVSDAYTSHRCLFEPLKKIISVIQYLDFSISSDSTTISLDQIDVTIDQMAYEFSTVPS